MLRVASPLHYPGLISTELVIVTYVVGQKSGLFFKVDNFATVNDRNACYMSKFSKFYLEKEYKTCMSVH